MRLKFHASAACSRARARSGVGSALGVGGGVDAVPWAVRIGGGFDEPSGLAGSFDGSAFEGEAGCEPDLRSLEEG